ncbi:hypothetical protein LOTGIDRAFT_229732 [Lottia gigantea]|uniref:Nucleoporin Nup159/Nup146 N-terminal domain-containing protein n=1 Tax=Lottia gigantea TaxID=225164 RepID=V3ZJV2_LOTGI|nr:hypothetical protein LOTGIDRAFT_229732 [Lottia gigantea]ESO82660.1 hypothetical protein LOTGIDRAFT_229732 [Lottia gigantea]
MGEFRVHHVRFFEYQPKTVHCLAYEKSTKQLAVSRSDGTIEIWLPDSDWLHLKTIPGGCDKSVEAIVWEGRRLFTAGLDGEVTEYNLLALQPIHSEPSNAGAIWCLTKNSTGTRLAAGTEDGCVVLFDIEMLQLRYLQSFGKQEGRILSIAWHTEEGIIITGGIDNIRLWSVKSGQAIQRLTLGHQIGNQETIVWTLAVTSNLTIISGDSRGQTCFWNGRQGTLIKSFKSHKADVLTLTVNEADDCVFSSGVDPLLVGFELIYVKNGTQQWVQSTTENIHKHDVRALCFSPIGVISAGIATNLCITNRKNGKIQSRRFHYLPRDLVHVSKEKKLILLQYPDYIEVWKLGHTNFTSENDGEILPLRSNPIKLLQLKCKSGEDNIICSNISNDCLTLAYSYQSHVRFYHLQVDEEEFTPKVSLNKIVTNNEDIRVPVHHIEFTVDGKLVVTATSSGFIQVFSIDDQQATLSNTFEEIESGIRLLTICSDNEYVAVTSGENKIFVYNLKTYQLECTLPSYDYPVRCFRFSPVQTLLVTYSNNMVIEFDVEKKEYTSWSRKNSQKLPDQWLTKVNKTSRISFNTSNNNHIILQDSMSFCIIDKSQPMPGKSERIFDKWNKEMKKERTFYQCKKYHFVMYVECLEDDWLVVVERTPLAILKSLPPTLKQKKFGT